MSIPIPGASTDELLSEESVQRIRFILRFRHCHTVVTIESGGESGEAGEAGDVNRVNYVDRVDRLLDCHAIYEHVTAHRASEERLVH